MQTYIVTLQAIGDGASRVTRLMASNVPDALYRAQGRCKRYERPLAARPEDMPESWPYTSDEVCT